MLLYPYVPLLLCLQNLCSSVSHKSPTPSGRGEAMPQERENQINTLAPVGTSPPAEGLGEAFFPILPVVQGALHSLLHSERGRG